jgi:hypothetical protein
MTSNITGTVAVWFSCGAASAVAAKKSFELYPNATIRVINNPVAEEDADNRRFFDDVQQWLGCEIEIATNSKFPDAACNTVWRTRRYMSGNAGAPCTLELTKRARQQWEERNLCDWLVLGFTVDELTRVERFRKRERKSLLTPLVDLKYRKVDCFRVLADAGIEVPAMYRRGYPNANCIGCVAVSTPTYWNHVRRDRPGVFNARAKLSRELGARLVRVNGERIFLDELNPNAVGASMDTADFECGLLCDMED